MRIHTITTLAVTAAAAVLAGSGVAAAAPSTFGPNCAINTANPGATVNDLRFGCSQLQYDTLYSALPAGAVPRNVTTQGFVRSNPVAELLWQGKVFLDGTATNRVAGAQVFPATVYVGSSFLDGRPAVIIDYPPGPLGFIRDEIREVQPGVYAGQVYDRSGAPRQVASFVLVL